MNQHFFFSVDTSLPRLAHVIQGGEDTSESGCEANDGRAGVYSQQSSTTVRWCPFPRTVHQVADDIIVASEHFVLVQDVQVDVETFQAVRQITYMPLTCSWISEMKRCSSWLFRVWSAVMEGLRLLQCGKENTQKKTSL